MREQCKENITNFIMRFCSFALYFYCNQKYNVNVEERAGTFSSRRFGVISLSAQVKLVRSRNLPTLAYAEPAKTTCKSLD